MWLKDKVGLNPRRPELNPGAALFEAVAEAHAECPSLLGAIDDLGVLL